jgi:hypothetical protein
MYTTALIWLLLTPLILSLIAFATRWLGRAVTRLVEIIHIITITIVLILTIIVLQGVLANGVVVAMNNWFHVDALAAIFLLIIGVVGFLVGLYSIGYIRNDVQIGELKDLQVSFYYGLFELFLFTMLLVVTANNIIIMWVASRSDDSWFCLPGWYLRPSFRIGSCLEVRDDLHCWRGLWSVWNYSRLLRCGEFPQSTRRGHPVDRDRKECPGTRPYPAQNGVRLRVDRVWHESRHLPDACLAARCP